VRVRSGLATTAQEAGGAAEDLLLMTRENQALTAELADATGERDRLQRRVVELAQLLSAREQAKKGVEVEKADLLDAYRAVLQEKRKMEEDMAALRAQKERAGLATMQMQVTTLLPCSLGSLVPIPWLSLTPLPLRRSLTVRTGPAAGAGGGDGGARRRGAAALGGARGFGAPG
jgi:hypothetical protein